MLNHTFAKFDVTDYNKNRKCKSLMICRAIIDLIVKQIHKLLVQAYESILVKIKVVKP